MPKTLVTGVREKTVIVKENNFKKPGDLFRSWPRDRQDRWIKWRAQKNVYRLKQRSFRLFVYSSLHSARRFLGVPSSVVTIMALFKGKEEHYSYLPHLPYVHIEDVVIANVDADKYKDLSEKYGVGGFPILKSFPKTNKAGEDYDGGRDLDDFVAFISEKAGTHHDGQGRLTSHAGKVPSMEALVKEFLGAAGGFWKAFMAI